MADQNKGMSDLWRRLRFVFMAIVVYRLGTHIPIPGIDPARLAALFDQNQGTILEMCCLLIITLGESSMRFFIFCMRDSLIYF